MTEGPSQGWVQNSGHSHPASENEAIGQGEELLWPWRHRLSPLPLPLLAMNQLPSSVARISYPSVTLMEGTSPVLSQQQISDR